MSEQITVTSFTIRRGQFILEYNDLEHMYWRDQNDLERFIDFGKAADNLVRGLLRRIRNSDPTFINISSLPYPITYELPDVREV